MTWWGWYYLIAGAFGAALYVILRMFLAKPDGPPLSVGRSVTGLILSTTLVGITLGSLLLIVFGVAHP
jgi:hypothetical protein